MRINGASMGEIGARKAGSGRLDIILFRIVRDDI